MSQQSAKDNSTANWLAVIAALLTAFILFLVYLGVLISKNGFFG